MRGRNPLHAVGQWLLTREQVADQLNVSVVQAYALIRRGDLAAIVEQLPSLRALKIGVRGCMNLVAPVHLLFRQ